MKGKKLLIAATALVTVMAMSACGGSSSSSAPASPSQPESSSIAPVVTAVSVSIDQNELLVGDEDYGTTSAKATVTGEGEFDKSVTWESSNPAVATVDEKGVITAVALGKATITATSKFNKSIKGSADVEVVPPHVTGISVPQTSAYIVLGEEGINNVKMYAFANTFGECDNAITWTSLNTSIATVSVDDTGVATVKGLTAGTCQLELTAGSGDYVKVRHIDIEVKPEGSALPANGGYSYVEASIEERTEILGILERYAMVHHLTGLSIMNNGGYSMVADGVHRGSDTYVPGYGFGTLSDGYIDKALTGDQIREGEGLFYHMFQTSDPKTINYMNDKGSVVGDLMAYQNAGYFGTFMNETKTGYDWVADLATENRPYMVDAEGKKITDPEVKKSTLFRIPLSLDVCYDTNTQDNSLKTFDGRKVALEDYVTPYQIYYTAGFKMVRGSENLTGSGSIKGASDYYKASAAGFNAEAWENVGIKTYTDGDEQGLQFELNAPCTPFYAMYYLTSGMFAPVPADFIRALGDKTIESTDDAVRFAEGTKNWGNFITSGTDITHSPVDTTLSTGPYTLSEWDPDVRIVWVKNQEYAKRDADHYAITGIHCKILKAASTDPEAALNQFLAGNLSSVSIPSTKKDEWIGKPGVVASTGDSNFKINVNTCNEEQWEALFGIEGSICQTAKEDYWEVEPALSNADFVDGISLSLDRVSFAQKMGRQVGFEYFADTYLSDPENGISYNKTKTHQDNLEALGYGSDTVYGYSFEKAKDSFNKAIVKLLEEGAYKDGDKIQLEIAWQEFSDETTYHQPIKQNIEAAFNQCSEAIKHNLTLECTFWASATWSDVYYAKMMVGQFDLGFGSVSGNTYDPLNFLEVLKSDNSSGFTLNWGIDTNTVSDEIIYDGVAWSFAGLWQAADTGAYIENGVVAPLISCGDGAVVANEDGTYTVTVEDVVQKNIDEDTYGEFTSLCIFATSDFSGYEDYNEIYVSKYDAEGGLNPNWNYNEETGVLTVTFAAEDMAEFMAPYLAAGVDSYLIGADIYYAQSICGVESNDFTTVAQEVVTNA